MSLLEERIKRSSRKTFAPPRPDLNATVVTTALSPQKENTPPNRAMEENTFVSNGVNNNFEQDDDMEEESLPPVNLPPQIVQEPPKKEIDGPFRLDPEFMKELDSIQQQLKVTKPQLRTFDLSFLYEEIKVPTIEEARAA
nr:uncharacterized protein LOC111516746 [Leptinotarsa decemlineata]